MLALTLDALTPLAYAAAASQAAQGQEFICHAGSPADAAAPQAPASDRGVQHHCPLCVLLTSHAAAPPLQIGATLPQPTRTGQADAVPADVGIWGRGAESQPFNPRAPPAST